jgi:hypothetical protein
MWNSVIYLAANFSVSAVQEMGELLISQLWPPRFPGLNSCSYFWGTPNVEFT